MKKNEEKIAFTKEMLVSNKKENKEYGKFIISIFAIVVAGVGMIALAFGVWIAQGGF